LVADLLDEVDSGFQIHAEVDELPLDSFLLVFLLLKDEHVMVEELLQTLVGVVDAQLLERVVLQTTNIAINSARNEERDIVVVSCPFVSFSVTLTYHGHIGCDTQNVSKRIISLGSLLFKSQTSANLT